MRLQFITDLFDFSFRLRSKFLPGDSDFQHRAASVQPETFDDQSDEHQFWLECRQQILHTLKLALLLGAICFIAFIVLDLHSGSLTAGDLPKRSIVIAVLLGLLVKLQRSNNPYAQIPLVAKLGASLSLLNLTGILLVENDPHYYAETWTSVLPIYFFTYGQLFMTTAESLLFGISAMLLMLLGGLWIGVASEELLASIVLMSIINVFGYCTRWQLEHQTRKLFKARRIEEAAVKDKVMFLRQIGHNLRQPLQALGCHASVLEAHFADGRDINMRQFVGRMAMAIDEVNNTCNRILDSANLELGKQLPVITNVDINTLLSTLEMQFQPSASKHKVRLKVCMRSHPPYMVQTDATILSQIISNLLDNAIKFTGNGWIVVNVSKIKPNLLKLRVIDTGSGINDEQQQHIFTDDYHGHRRGNEHHIKGFGIGLAFVAKAIKQLPKHAIKLHSRIGVGSDFQIYLPVSDIKNAGESLPLYRQSTSELQGLLIFIVDDEMTVVEALRAYFLQCGCVVEVATSVAETKLVLNDCLRQPDLLISDFYLGHPETALDIIAILESECGRIPTLILSAHAICDADKSRLPENTALLRKPANTVTMTTAIAKLLQTK